ncbi:hypothetical protein CEXT_190471 [Caerostris extrusa]|uniref:Uncharacterized protein n=1 Tax=Caerostris extrusa TaxID=172846 RepID=A0AAV4PNA3_CAEEX|nr:hypothetical protein CEXT_190471 [Caerostris extrusa]
MIISQPIICSDTMHTQLQGAKQIKLDVSGRSQWKLLTLQENSLSARQTKNTFTQLNFPNGLSLPTIQSYHSPLLTNQQSPGSIVIAVKREGYNKIGYFPKSLRKKEFPFSKNYELPLVVWNFNKKSNSSL